MTDHEGHEMVALTGHRPSGSMVGYLFCTECSLLVMPIPVCGAPTLKGRPCRTPIRVDLGYRSCWSHGEGAGRTSRP
jgi:hypothetical protein